MSDDLMDARLCEAGERWRAEHPGSVQTAPETEELLELRAPHRPRRIRWLAAASAAVVVAAISAGVVLFAQGSGHHKSLGSTPTKPSTDTATTARKYDSAQLVGKDWTLSGTETSSSSGNKASGSGSSATSESVLRFDGKGGFTLTHRCYTNHGRAKFSATTVQLSDVELLSAVPCASNAETLAGKHENDLVDALLKGTVTWSLDSGELTISKDGKSATFDNRSADAAPTLLRFTWYLESVAVGVGPYGTGSMAKERLPLRIRSGTLHVGNDCNSASGPVRLQANNHLRIGALSAAGCFGPGPGVDEKAVLAVLRGTVTYQITGDQLTITKTGVGELVFTKS